MPKPPKNIFIQGAIPAQKIADSLASHQAKTEIGAHAMFMGQVRADNIEGKTVAAIEYTAYEEMANRVMHEIREEAFAAYDLTCAHIYHSLGRVATGELCFFVFTSSPHRAAAFDACRFLVEEIKEKVPIYGKELFNDETAQWKVNK